MPCEVILLMLDSVAKWFRTNLCHHTPDAELRLQIQPCKNTPQQSDDDEALHR